jgi:hypothetical protein
MSTYNQMSAHKTQEMWIISVDSVACCLWYYTIVYKCDHLEKLGKVYKTFLLFSTTTCKSTIM